MANYQSSKELREKIETAELSMGLRHTGTREALIAAGLAKPGQFPGEPDCGKWSTVFPADGEHRKRQVSRRSPYLYDVVVYWNPDERAAYAEKSREDIEAVAAARADPEFQRFLSRLPKS